MNILGLFELVGRATVQRRGAAVAELREAVAVTSGRADQAERALATVSAHFASHRSEPPAVAGELIVMADRLADLTASGATPTTEILGWVRGRVDALLAMCEVAPVIDSGAIDFLRHEVVGDRPAPREGLVDHIADTVRPGYVWRRQLIRPQQVVAFVDMATD